MGKGKKLKHTRSFAEIVFNDPVLGILLVMPLLLWVLATIIYPLFNTIYFSFFNIRYIGVPFQAVGVTNYRYVFQDPNFLLACGRSVLWTLTNIVLQVVGSLVVALILNQSFRGRDFIRNWVILPWVLPTVVVAIVWKWILDPTHGVANYLLTNLGLVAEPVQFLASPQWAMLTTIFINAWRWVPYFSIILLAALQTIQRELYEAAAIDGASTWSQFRYITLPVISPVLNVVILNSLLWSVNIFDTIWLLTRGGPIDYTTTLPIYIYKKAFQEFRFGEASAASVIMFLGLLLIVVVYLRKLFREGEEIGGL